MNDTYLESLLIDQSLGELTDESSALLDAYLERSPEAREVANRIGLALTLTKEVVETRGIVFEQESDPVPFPLTVKAKMLTATLMKIAAILVALALAVGAGFLTGEHRSGSSVSDDAFAGSGSISTPSPWVRYRFEKDGRFSIVATTDPKS